jgi:hypothetical protein
VIVEEVVKTRDHPAVCTNDHQKNLRRRMVFSPFTVCTTLCKVSTIARHKCKYGFFYVPVPIRGRLQVWSYVVMFPSLYAKL